MFEGRGKKYLMWFVLLAAALFPPVMIMLFYGPEMVKNPQFYGQSQFGMCLSFLVLILTAFVGALMAIDPYTTKIPRWISGILICGVVGYLTAILLSIGTSHSSEVFFAYIPGVTLSLSVVFTFLIQTWVAVEKLELSLLKALPVHMVFAVWTLLSLTNPAETGLIVLSAAAILALVFLGKLTDITAEGGCA